MPAGDEEVDMFDGAFDMTETSRPSWQIPLAPGMDGLRLRFAPVTESN